MTTSDGPDRWHGSVKCLKHHDGIRSGFGDYCCCCNPCLYVTGWGSEPGKLQHACCRCIPHVIRMEFVPDNAEDACCRTIGYPLFVLKSGTGGTTWGVYYGGLFGVDVTIKVGFRSDYDHTCVWSIHSDALSLDEEVEIDHVDVTCLSVPGFVITGVPGFGGTCEGSLVFSDHDRTKVPFVKRTFPERPSHTVELTSNCDSCHWACRDLWVRGKLRPDALEWGFGVFSWDESFIPTESIKGVWDGPYGEHIKLTVNTDPYDANYGKCQLSFFLESDTGENEYFVPLSIDPDSCTGCDLHVSTGDMYDYGSGQTLHLDISCSPCRSLCVAGKRHLRGNNIFFQEWVEFEWDENFQPDLDAGLLGRWVYSPDIGRDEWIAVLQDMETGELSLKFFLENDDGLHDYFPNTPISGRCTCLVNAASSAGPLGLDQEYLGVQIQCGHCSCWTRLCGSCRCVNSTICMSGMIHGNVFTTELATWNPDSLCWESANFTVCIVPQENGTCGVQISYVGYDPLTFDTLVADQICGVLTAVSAQKIIDLGGGNYDVNYVFGASHMGGGCAQAPCNDAAPCASTCGGNPDTLTVNFHRFPYTPDFIPPEYWEPDCYWEITLVYWQQFFWVGSPPIEIGCGYVGYKTLADGTLVKVELRFGRLTVSRLTSTNPDVFTAYTDFSEVELTEETCDPYYGARSEITTEFNPCGSGGLGISNRVDVVITQ